MDIVDRLEFKHLLEPLSLLREAADTIICERLVSDKLYRALRLAVDFPDRSEFRIIEEALNSYEMARLTHSENE